MRAAAAQAQPTEPCAPAPVPILTGVERNAAGQHAYMPAFGAGSQVHSLSDAEIAALSGYVLTSLGNGEVRVTPADVAVRRAGGPTVPLVIAVRWGLPLAALVLAVLAILLFRRLRAKMASSRIPDGSLP